MGFLCKIGASKMPGLLCPHISCSRRIRSGVTGLQELEKVRAHFLRCHNEPLTPEEALDVRTAAEDLTEEKGYDTVPS